jgi:hypothetical protein
VLGFVHGTRQSSYVPSVPTRQPQSGAQRSHAFVSFPCLKPGTCSSVQSMIKLNHQSIKQTEQKIRNGEIRERQSRPRVGTGIPDWPTTTFNSHEPTTQFLLLLSTAHCWWVVEIYWEPRSARDPCGLAGAAGWRARGRGDVGNPAAKPTRSVTSGRPPTRRTCVSMSVVVKR